ncbi:hypothetical protein ACLB2K_045913 [Fragaria x ananassa]
MVFSVQSFNPAGKLVAGQSWKPVLSSGKERSRRRSETAENGRSPHFKPECGRPLSILSEAPCEDFITHFFCHLCAICQEYREIREKSAESGPGDLNVAIVTAPAVQTMEPAVDK